MSLALYDKDGVLVRSLLYAKPVQAGKQSVEWDGTTDMGKPAKAGSYTAKGVFFTSSPSLQNGMIVGKSGNPPWRTPDGKGDWGGNLGFPSSIVSNGKSIVLTSAAVEDNQVTGIQEMDGDGNIATRYFSFYPWDVRMTAAMDDTNYYLGIVNGSKQQLEIAEYKIGQPQGKIHVVLPTIAHKNEADSMFHGLFSNWLDGLAITKDTIFATIKADNALFIIDRASGQIRKQLSIASPRGIAISNGKLLLVSGSKVLRLNLDGSIESTLVKEGIFQDPSPIVIDADNNFYVGDGGSGLGPFGLSAKGGTRQVHVFSADGKPLRRIGKTGGAPLEGHYDENGLGIITSVAIAPGANKEPSIWINDVALGFFRTSRWSMDGKLERQWFMHRLTLNTDIINPARPNELVNAAGAFTDDPGISAYEFDVVKKTWKPSWKYNESYADMYQEDVFLGHKHDGNPLTKALGPDAAWPVFHYDSRNFVSRGKYNYFMVGGSNNNGAIFTYGPDHKPKPVAMVSYHRSQKRADGKIEGFYQSGPNNWFTWADKNGDGRMALDEVIYTENPESMAKTPVIADAQLDANLNVVMKRFIDENGKWRLVDSFLPLKEVLPNGAPVYDYSQLRDSTPIETPDLTGGDGTKKISMYTMPIALERDNALYSMVDASSAQPLVLPGIDGYGWWASRNWRKKIAKWDKKTGKLLWAVGRRAPGKAENGQMYHPVALAGVEGGAVFITDTLGPNWVWSTDGLFLGHVYNDYYNGVYDDKTLYGEIQSTTVYSDPITKKIYSVANDTGAHIHEVVLPKLTPVTAGTITLTSQQAAQAMPWDPDGVMPTEKPTYEVRYVKGAREGVTIDGDLTGYEGWEDLNGVGRPDTMILMDGQQVARVRMMYNEKTLYLSYRVNAPNGVLNAGSELPISPFVSGAYVDFSIAPNWTGPRSEVREGDVRVLLARIKNAGGEKDFQQGFWQKKVNGINPQTITSPAAQVKFDQITEVPGLQMAYKVTDVNANGQTSYNVEVAVPLASLGLENPAGKTFGFDASIGISNAEGNRRERAAHWAGLSEGVVVDRPGSTQLLPTTWGTIRFAPSP